MSRAAHIFLSSSLCLNSRHTVLHDWPPSFPSKPPWLELFKLITSNHAPLPKPSQNQITTPPQPKPSQNKITTKTQKPTKSQIKSHPPKSKHKTHKTTKITKSKQPILDEKWRTQPITETHESWTTNHKPMLEITYLKSERAYLKKFLTQNQITKPTQIHHTYWNTTTLAKPPQPSHLDQQQRPTNHKLDLIFFTGFALPLFTLVATVKL